MDKNVLKQQETKTMLQFVKLREEKNMVKAIKFKEEIIDCTMDKDSWNTMDNVVNKLVLKR